MPELHESTVEEVVEIIDKAYRAQPAFAGRPGIERLRLLKALQEQIVEHADRFVAVIAEETGKSPGDARGEVGATIERIDYMAQDAREMFGTLVPSGWSDDTRERMALVQRVPLGVVAVVGPFNYPLFIPAVKAMVSLLAGNTVVLKPSSLTPKTMLLFEETVHAAGFSDDVFRVVVGSGSKIGDALVSSPKVAAVSFTGSTTVGERITRTAGIKRLLLELGGKGVAVVFPDADMEQTAKKIAEGAFKNAGQRCDAVSVVVYIGTANVDRFVEALQTETRKWNARPSQPLVTVEASLRVYEMLLDAIDRGAQLRSGGMLVSERRQLEPTLLDHVPRDASLAREETFGPVVPIVRVATEDEAVAFHNSLPGGLDSSIWTSDLRRALALAERLKTGSVTINDAPRHGIGLFPYGGSGQSGIGREGVGYSLLEVTETKTVVLPKPLNTVRE